MPLSESLELVSTAFSWSLIKFKSTPNLAKDGKGYCWESDGGGSYEIEEVDGQRRGTKIVIHLKRIFPILPRKIELRISLKNTLRLYSFLSPLTERK